MKKLFVMGFSLSLFLTFLGCELQRDTHSGSPENSVLTDAEKAAALREAFDSETEEEPGAAEKVYSTLNNLNQLAANVTSTDNAVYQLARTCVAIKSPATGKFLKNTSTLLGPLYKFEDTSSNSAAHFYMKPAEMGKFLLTDREGKYLASIVPSTETTTDNPSLATEWSIEARDTGSNNFQFKLKNRLTRQSIQNEYWVKKMILWGLVPTWELHTEQHFTLEEQNDCRPYPEIAVNAENNPDVLKDEINNPVRGFIDAHCHITSYEFMGGKVVHGEAFHRWGAPWALPDSKYSHGPDGSLDLIGNIFTFGSPTFKYNTGGWPDFPWWPNHEQMTHTGYYYKWMERAWRSGQRMMVTFLVENEVLCKAQRAINPIGWVGNSCNAMDSIRFQVQRLRQMESYIDAQFGGPGNGFFRIVSSPEEARRVIADGKMAILMGIEVSEIFNCGGMDSCSTDTIEAGLQEVYNLGIRSLFVAHKFDNQLSGAILEEGFINIGEVLSTGHYYETTECNANTGGKRMSAGLPLVGDIPFIEDLLDMTGIYPSYDQDIEHHCNIRGLTPLGVYLVNRMIDMGMLIELDHLSADAITQVLDIAEARNYSGVVSSHSFMHRDRNGNLHEDFKRMLGLGGFAAPYNKGTYGMENAVDRYLTAVEDTPFLNSVGLGTDMSGLGGQPGPRSNSATDPFQYPYTTEFGTTFDRQVSGNRTFDYNQDGMAHYGMLPDHIQDLRLRGSKRVYDALMNSTEGYLQMWERSEANSDEQYFDPL